MRWSDFPTPLAGEWGPRLAAVEGAPALTLANGEGRKSRTGVAGAGAPSSAFARGSFCSSASGFISNRRKRWCDARTGKSSSSERAKAVQAEIRTQRSSKCAGHYEAEPSSKRGSNPKSQRPAGICCSSKSAQAEPSSRLRFLAQGRRSSSIQRSRRQSKISQSPKFQARWKARFSPTIQGQGREAKTREPSKLRTRPKR